MTFTLYTDLALACDLPEHRLRRGDLLRLVEHHVAEDGSAWSQRPDTGRDRSACQSPRIIAG